MSTTSSLSSSNGTRAFVEGYIGLMLVVMQMLLLMFLDRTPEYFAATRNNYQPPIAEQIFDRSLRAKVLTYLTLSVNDDALDQQKVDAMAELISAHDLSVKIEGDSRRGLWAALHTRERLIARGVPNEAVTVHLTTQQLPKMLTLTVLQ